MKVLWKYLGKVKAFFLFSVVAVIVEAAAELLQPTMLSKIIDVGIANKDLRYVLATAGIMLLFVLLEAVAAMARNYFSSVGAEKVGAMLRFDLYRKIQDLSPDELDRFGAGTLVTRTTNDVTQVQNLARGMMRVFIRAPILCVGGIVLSMSLNRSLGMIPLCIMPVVFGIIALNIKIGFPLYTRVQEALDKVNTVMRQYLSGVRVVKAFNRFNFEKKRFDIPNSELRQTSIRAAHVIAGFRPTLTICIYIGIVTILWFGGVKVNAGQMRTGQVIAFVSYMTQILQSLTMFSNIFHNFVRAKASCTRIGEILDSQELQYMPENPLPIDTKEGLSFENVTFSYRGKKPALKGVSFTCDIGEKVGIIGSTGSGKTTLISLILQFYQPNEGKIMIFGADATKSDPKEVRKGIAVVQQRVMLFTGTIRENILWGREDATQQEVENAAREACAHGFIVNLKDGYDTLIGHNGIGLSGGQRQRISIARALVRKPRILILDDCLSAVDALTEADLRENLAAEASGRGVLIVSQKISSIIDCDRIVVLDDGAAVGVGMHADLLSSCPVYRDLYAFQYGLDLGKGA